MYDEAVFGREENRVKDVEVKKREGEDKHKQKKGRRWSKLLFRG